MNTVYLVRHGQTAWNREEIFRGRADIPLNETGRKEALLTGQYLRGVKVDSIYSSPLSRALETAETIARPVSFRGISALPRKTSSLFQAVCPCRTR